jgi:hypothetical protein
LQSHPSLPNRPRSSKPERLHEQPERRPGPTTVKDYGLARLSLGAQAVALSEVARDDPEDTLHHALRLHEVGMIKTGRRAHRPGPDWRFFNELKRLKA